MVTICGNGTGSCRSNNYENSTSQDWFNEDTSPRNKPTTKAPEKHPRKDASHRDRLNKKRKLDFLAIAEIRSHAINGSRKQIVTKHLSGSRRQALRSDALNSISFEYKKMSEKRDLSEMASVADVFQKSPNVSRTKAALKTKKVGNGRKKRMTKRVQVLVVPIPIPQISKEVFRNKPDRPHPLEIEKTGHFTSTDLQHDAIISYLSWVFLGSAALSLWAVLLDSIRNYIKSHCRQHKAHMSLKHTQHRQIVVNSGESI